MHFIPPIRRLGALRPLALSAAVAITAVACQSREAQEGFGPPSEIQTDTTLTTVAGATANAYYMALDISPASVAVSPGQSVGFTALQWTAGVSSSFPYPFRWSATGGTISSDGVYHAGTVPGTYRVVAEGTTTAYWQQAAVTISASTASITRVLVAPATASLAPAAKQQFAASASLSDGSTQSAPAVSWTATGGTVSSTGLYTAGSSAGSYRVIARSSNGKADTSTVSIATTAAVITAITLTPSAVSLAPGASQQLTAMASMSNGTTQANPTVTWSATGGTVTTGGLYTAGSSAGTFRVIAASSNGKADTSAVTVSNLTTAGPDVLNNASFESGWDGFLSGSATTPNGAITRSTDRAFDGTTSVKVAWNAGGGEVSAQAFHDIGPQTHFWTRAWYYLTALPNGTGFKFVRYQDGGFNVANGMQILNGKWIWVGNSNEAIAYTNSSPIVGGWHYVEFEWDRTAKQIRMWQDGTPMQGASADAGLSWSGTTLTYTSDIGPRNLDLIRVVNAPTNSGAVYLDRIAVSTKGRIGP